MYKYLLFLLVACAAKPVLPELDTSAKTEAIVGASCTDDAGCDLGELCDRPVCIPEGPPCPTEGRCVNQRRFYDLEATPIPDADPEGVARSLVVEKPGLVVASVNVNLNVEHTYRGDLVAALTSPEGTIHLLHDRSGGSADDLNLTADVDAFAGEAATGTWTLRISDNARLDEGTLRSWRLSFEYAEGEPEPEPEPQWADVEVDLQSPHPYANDMSEVYDLRRFAAGDATRLHFVRVALESGYDFLEVRHAETGEVFDRVTGEHEDLTLGPYETTALELHLVTDYSVTGWGFWLDRVDVRNAGCMDDADCAEDQFCPEIVCIRHPCFSFCQPREEPAECADGETRDDGCNTCTCTEGRWACTERACVSGEGEACGGDTVCAAGLHCDHGMAGGNACGGVSEATGTCVRFGPRICPRHIQLVCTCNGQTFNNDCERIGHGDFAHEGPCALDVPIPDADPSGARATVTVLRPAASTSVRAQVGLRHTWRGDLVVTIVAPDGTRHRLSDREGGGDDDFEWSGTVELAGSVVGAWTLEVVDLARQDRGVIERFNVVANMPETSEGRVCGTRGALPCAPTESCVFPAGSCGADDRGGVCEARPETCTFEHAPVCGCDGRTYHNACAASRAGVSIANEGACAEQGDFCGGLGNAHHCAVGEYCHHDLGEICGWADAPGECRRAPEACIALYDPVCGCDGETYSNACRANQAGVSVEHVGPCD